MSEGRIGGRSCDANRHDGGTAALGAADRLSLAAAPAFAIMALLTAAHGGGPADILCSATLGVSQLSGMVPMYLLMSIVHTAPWLKLITGRRKAAPTKGET
jgi:hypothetical protein